MKGPERFGDVYSKTPPKGRPGGAFQGGAQAGTSSGGDPQEYDCFADLCKFSDRQTLTFDFPIPTGATTWKQPKPMQNPAYWQELEETAWTSEAIWTYRREEVNIVEPPHIVEDCDDCLPRRPVRPCPQGAVWSTGGLYSPNGQGFITIAGNRYATPKPSIVSKVKVTMTWTHIHGRWKEECLPATNVDVSGTRRMQCDQYITGTADHQITWGGPSRPHFTAGGYWWGRGLGDEGVGIPCEAIGPDRWSCNSAHNTDPDGGIRRIRRRGLGGGVPFGGDFDSSPAGSPWNTMAGFYHLKNFKKFKVESAEQLAALSDEQMYNLAQIYLCKGDYTHFRHESVPDCRRPEVRDKVYEQRGYLYDFYVHCAFTDSEQYAGSPAAMCPGWQEPGCM